jgi:sugar-specific transcriptional regulator TrmB
MNNISQLLEGYGLSERESKVYLYLLQKLEDTVLGVANATNIPRTTVYTILTNLKEQNLVSSFRKNKIQFWSPESINQLQANVKRKEDVVSSLLPLLKDIVARSHNNDSSVRLFTGIEGLKVVWEDVISYSETKKIPLMCAISHNSLFQILPKYFPAWLERRKKAKIFAKLIINKNDFIHTEDSQEVRYMDEKYLFPGEITIYGDKVAMFIFEKNHYEAIIIDSPTFTQMVQGIFNFTWDMLGQSIEKK